jgi:hypothetical protein
VPEKIKNAGHPSWPNPLKADKKCLVVFERATRTSFEAASLRVYRLTNGISLALNCIIFENPFRGDSHG